MVNMVRQTTDVAMRDGSLFFLFSPVTKIKGLGTATSDALRRLLPQATSLSGTTEPIIRDLLFHLPVSLIDRRFTCPLNEAPEGIIATFIVDIDAHFPPPSGFRGGKRPYKVECSNDSGTITLVFFHAQTDYIKQSMPVGSQRVISGRTEFSNHRLQMTHPDIITTPDKLADVQKQEPVYPLTIGLTSKRIAKYIDSALEKLPILPEWLDTKSPPPLRGRVREGGVLDQDAADGYSERTLEHAKDLRKNTTEPEQKVWQLLRRKQLENYKFRRQQPIGEYIVDFFCPKAKLVIELDGGKHSNQKTYDNSRTEYLEKQGYKVIRFWNHEVIENIEAVYDSIRATMEKTPPPSPLPQVEGELQFPDWKTALTRVHHPEYVEDLMPSSSARKRLAYDEMLSNQLHLALLRRNMQQQHGAIIKGTGALTKPLLASLPFKLTQGQLEVLEEIHNDMSAGKRMGRLLQGDVGSGKTIVALLAMLRVAENNLQSALMVPTEIIAQQHYETISKLTATLGIKVALLTGSIKGKARQTILDEVASGAIQILVGTHALFQEHVIFKSLALVVIDEQHRFGVAQRMALTNKGSNTHLLHMTATPIPRSLTMTLYGDMDCSLLKEKPAERLKITTRVIALSRYDDVMERIKDVLDKGEKIYWICPLIEEKEVEGELNLTPENDIAAAETRFIEFKERFGPIVGLVHGRMKNDQRDAEMKRFASGETRLLVATTVVEVGVDVRDATIIVIEKAERFGLSQLHQLRGRVGRGNKASSCVLLYSDKVSEVSRNRLATLRESDDGFAIAEADLEIRGGGDLLGSRQSGLPRFIFTHLLEHRQLLEHARLEAAEFLSNDPDFSSPRGKALLVLMQLFS